MSQVSVPSTGDPQVACEDGQETRIRRLAQYVDARSASSSDASARSARPGCCCSPRSSSPTNCPMPTRRCSRRAAAPAAGNEADAARRRAASTASPSASSPLRPGWRHPSYQLRVGLRGALGRISPGADTYLLGAVPVGVVASIHGAHLLRRATRELQADGRGGSIPTCPSLRRGRSCVNILLLRRRRRAVRAAMRSKAHLPGLRRELRARSRRSSTPRTRRTASA